MKYDTCIPLLESTPIELGAPISLIDSTVVVDQEDAEVHNDSEETRLKALKMGSNIIEYVFLGKN